MLIALLILVIFDFHVIAYLTDKPEDSNSVDITYNYEALNKDIIRLQNENKKLAGIIAELVDEDEYTILLENACEEPIE